MLAKLRADIRAIATGKTVKWEHMLPPRLQESAQVASFSAGAMKLLTRSLSSVLDGYVKQHSRPGNNAQAPDGSSVVINGQ